MTMQDDRYDGMLAQMIGMYGSATEDESKYVRKKAHKNKGFAEAAIILKLNERMGCGKKRASNDVNVRNDDLSNSTA
jgi:hypothetical protein